MSSLLVILSLPPPSRKELSSLLLHGHSSKAMALPVGLGLTMYDFGNRQWPTTPFWAKSRATFKQALIKAVEALRTPNIH